MQNAITPHPRIFFAITGIILFSLYGCNRSKPKNKAPAPPDASNHAAVEKQVEPEKEPVDPVAPEVLMEAALEGRDDTVSEALTSGTDPDIVDENGRTALMLAAFNGHTGIARKLIDAGAKVNRQDGIGRSALMYAATGPNVETVGLLLSHGAEINATDSGEQWTPLMFSAAEGHSDVVHLLLDQGADPTVIDTDGDSAASFARQRGHLKLAELLEESITSE